MVRRRHDMPFGAAVLPDGGVRFRLWAPAARSVALLLETHEMRPALALQPAGDGWFELTTDAARAGDLYRYVIDGDAALPDPASRFQPAGVHGASEIVDPAAFAWPDGDWRGRPWEEAVIYELHVGAFTAAGDHAGVAARLDHLVGLGVTAVELMPLAATPGRCNWGYDGVQLFAPDARYGRPDSLKALVVAAHRRGLMVLLDVVYNHFGPEGNYLARYAPDFFARQRTPWGEAIDFSGDREAPVRAFFRHNALYWLEEYHFDGLRLDAAQAMRDDGEPHILDEIAAAVRDSTGSDRHIHLVLENDDNAVRHLGRAEDGRPRFYTAQWNDDFHHVLHGLLTDEADGHYRDYQDRRAARLGRVLAEGFDYQGEPSLHRGGRRRGEPSGGLPPPAFVAFLQNHDHVGNRAFGERLGMLAEPAALRAAIAVLLLAPSVPLLFMGEEWQADEPFLFFSDLAPELAAAVRAGRRRDFAKFRDFGDPDLSHRLPDPQDPANLARSTLRWTALAEPGRRDWLAYYRGLLALRHAEIVPRLAGIQGGGASYAVAGSLLAVAWRLGDGSRLSLTAVLGEEGAPAPPKDGRILFTTHPGAGKDTQELPPWFVAWSIAAPAGD
jgi:malto-oligosyltrehalose trehalohydrolase